MMGILPVLAVILFSVPVIMGHKKLTDVVQTHKGPVRGKILKTVVNSVEYSAFKGIPFGKAPLGEIRFKPPSEVDSWNETYYATSEPSSCPQIIYDFKLNKTEIGGKEDCLYLNLYTPKTNFQSSDDDLLAVMVWIAGGGFISAFINSTQYGPDFLIEENVIMVAMNYRVGALGFMSLNHPNATGNAGLKDQVLALKWVQRNIRNFGGDPNRVTLFGESTGAVAVELHKLSKLSEGLFHRSIAMSGSPLNPWGFFTIDEAERKAYNLGRRLGILTTNKDEFLAQFYKIPPEKIVSYELNNPLQNDLPVKPTFENEDVAAGEVFLSDCPIRRYKSRQFAQLPHIMGFTNSETLTFTYLPLLYLVIQVSWKRISKLPMSPLFFVDIVRDTFDRPIRSTNDISTAVLYKIINMTSDIAFIANIDETQRYLAEGAKPVYYYRNSFHYDNMIHLESGADLNGTGHADDLAMLFWMPDRYQRLDLNDEIAVQRRKMARMWANFAKYADPTPDGGTDSLLNVTWLPSGVEGNVLEIKNGQYAMGPRPVDDTVKAIQRASKRREDEINECDKKNS